MSASGSPPRQKCCLPPPPAKRSAGLQPAGHPSPQATGRARTRLPMSRAGTQSRGHAFQSLQDPFSESFYLPPTQSTANNTVFCFCKSIARNPMKTTQLCFRELQDAPPEVNADLYPATPEFKRTFVQSITGLAIVIFLTKARSTRKQTSPPVADRLVAASSCYTIRHPATHFPRC